MNIHLFVFFLRISNSQAADIKGVHPFLSHWFKSAPLLMRISKQSLDPPAKKEKDFFPINNIYRKI